MTPEDEKILTEYRLLQSQGWHGSEECFIAGWRAAIKHIQEKREQWEFSSHRRE